MLGAKRLYEPFCPSLTHKIISQVQFLMVNKSFTLAIYAFNVVLLYQRIIVINCSQNRTFLLHKKITCLVKSTRDSRRVQTLLDKAPLLSLD